jgi:hypothetical protein
MYQRFKVMMYDRKVRLFNWPIPEGRKGREAIWTPYLLELLELESKRVSHNLIDVRPPRKRHDDRADAIMRSVWLSSEQLFNMPVTSGLFRADARTPLSATSMRNREAALAIRHNVPDTRRSPRAHALAASWRSRVTSRFR